MQFIHTLFIGGLSLLVSLPAFSVGALPSDPGMHQEIAQSAASNEQRVTIKGVVRLATTKEPVSGANISVDGSAAITEDDGTFEIDASSDNVKLVVRFPGYQDKIVFTKGSGVIEILLFEEGYAPLLQTAKFFNNEENRLNTVGAVEVVDLSRYQWRSTVNENMASVLQGKVAGLNTIRYSGTTNAGANLMMRGINSFHGTSRPLLVVDGMLYDDNDYSHDLIGNYFESGLANIDIKDIDNITVVKDGSSQFGTKGSNGVVFITTAQVDELATRIHFGAYSSFNRRPALLPVMGGNEHRAYLSELLGSQGLSSAEIAEKPYFLNSDQALDYYAYNNDTDWQSMVMDNSLSQHYFLKVTGGDNIAKYALSAGYVNNRGILNYDEITKYTMRLNGVLSLSKRFTVQPNLSFYYNQHNLRAQGVDSYSSPLYTALVKSPMLYRNVFNESGNVSPLLADVDVFNQTNPAVLISDNTVGRNLSYRFVGNIHFGFEFNEKFHVKSIAGLVYDKGRENFFLPENGVYAEELPLGEVRNQSGSEVRRMFSLYNDTYVDFQTRFSTVHDWNTRVGMRVQTNRAEYDYGLGFNSANDDYVTIGSGSNLLRQIRGGFGNWNWVNFYMVNRYALKDRYLFSWESALDGSSRFGDDPRHNMLKFGPTALAFSSSLSAAWIVSAERFFQSPLIDLLKIRASYGLSGNDDIGDYAARQFYLSQNLLGVQGLIRGNIGNPQLQWENALKGNVGIDATMANERINLSVDFYRNDFKHVVTYQALQVHSGMDVVFRNGASLRNTGLELGINGRIINSEHTQVDLGIQLSRYRNEVTSMAGGSFETPYYGGTMITQVGAAANAFYGLQTDGIYTTEQEARDAGLNRQLSDGTLVPFKAGDVRFIDQNGDKIIDSDDRTIIGDPNPDWFGAFSATLNHKRWSIHALLTYSLGNDVYNAVRRNLESQSNYDNQTIAVLNRWKQEGQQTDIPRAHWGDPMGNADFSSRWIEDGSYLRIREVNIGYRLPLQTEMLRSIDLYLTANNLFTFSKYLGYDPEFSGSGSIYSQGVDIGLAPQYRSFQLGARIGF